MKYNYSIKSTQAVFYDNLTYIYLDLTKFTKTLDELRTHFDPAQLGDSVFTNLFEKAEIANIDDEEYREYEESLKTYRDLKNSIDTARGEGREEGRREGGKEEKITIAGKLKR